MNTEKGRLLLWMGTAAGILLLLMPVAMAAGESPAAGSLPDTMLDTAVEQWRTVQTPDLERAFGEIEEEIRGWGVSTDVPSVISRLREGGFLIDLPRVVKALGHRLAGEVPGAMVLLGKLVLVALVAGVLGQLGAVFGGSVAKVAYVVCFLAFMGIALSSFVTAFAAARLVVSRLVSLMLALIPPFLVLTAAGGTPATAGLLHPALMLAVNGAGVVGVTVAMPLLFSAALVELVDGLNEKRRLEGLSTLLKQISVWATGAAMAAFLGVAVVQGAAGRALDGVTVRTAKFVSGTFVPVIGKMFSDATDVVFASARLVGTGLGLVGMVAVLAVALFPLLKILLLVVSYRLAAAVVAAVDGGRLAWGLRGIASALSWLGVIVGVVAVMFLVSIAILIGAARPG